MTVTRTAGGPQLELAFDVPSDPEESLLLALRAHGLRGITRLRLTRNRSVMVSYRGDVLRVHEAYRGAPPDVLRAIARFVIGRRPERRAAERVILEHAARTAPAMRSRPRRPDRPHPGDHALVVELERWHAEFNQRFFDGSLGPVSIRVSGRMRRRLGQYTVAAGDAPAEIAIGRSHVRRHGWPEALRTLLHEMIHQWQAECGLPLGHGREFREKEEEIRAAASRETVAVSC